MKNALALAALLLLAGCSTSRPHPDERSLAGLIAPPVRPDSAAVAAAPDSIVVAPHRSLLDKVLHKPTAAPRQVAANAVRIGKKATVNFYYAAATITTIGKKAGPAVVASDAVRQNTAGTNTQQTAVTGTGNQVSAKKADTTAEAPGFGGALGKPLGIALAVAASVAALYFIIPFLIRRKAEKIIS